MYGIDNVRGGSYCQVNLNAEQRKLLETELNSVDNKCYNCHKIGHMAAKCPEKSFTKINQICRRCLRSNHSIESCYASMNIYGEPIYDSPMDDYAYTNICIRCLRSNHSIENCYANVNAYGEHIPDDPDIDDYNISDLDDD